MKKLINTDWWQYIQKYHLLLIFGSILGLCMANFASHTYHTLLDTPIFANINLHFLVNDVLMSLFFAVAGKEVWEAIALKRGSLRGKKAITPIIATFGGIVGPILVYLVVASMFGSATFSAIKNGWAIPTATDIAFAYLVGTLIFGKNHQAMNFLLALAILDDAIGLIILAIFYPSSDINLHWLWLSGLAVLLVWIFFRKIPSLHSCAHSNKKLPYVLAGIISWWAFHKAGIHPVLSLLVVIPIIPHAESDMGIFAENRNNSHDMLNSMEHALQVPIVCILGLFGFVNAGVPLSAINAATASVMAGLLIGKPLGITVFGIFGERFFGLPHGMFKKDLPVLGAVAGIGFTVSLFVSVQAFGVGAWQDGAKMGALFSFSAAMLAFVLSRVFKIRKQHWLSCANPYLLVGDFFIKKYA